MSGNLAMLDVSKHAWSRMQQRGYTKRDIEFLCCYGTPVTDGYLFTRQDALELENDLGWPTKGCRLPGTVVIAQQGTMVTVFRAGKAAWRRLAKNERRRIPRSARRRAPLNVLESAI